MMKHSEEFKQEAVRIALTSGLPRERVALSLQVSMRVAKVAQFSASRFTQH